MAGGQPSFISSSVNSSGIAATPMPSKVHIIENGIIIPPSEREIETGLRFSPLKIMLRLPDTMNVAIVV